MPARATTENRRASSRRTLPAYHHEDEARQPGHGGQAAGAHEGHGAAAVLAGDGIVVVAEEENGVGGGADLVRRRLDERQAHVARLILEAVEVARDAPARGQDHERGGVRELVALRVVGVLEAGDVRNLADGRLRPGEEVPGAHRLEAAVALHIFLFLRRGVARGVARIDADGDDLVLLAGIELQRGERGDDALHDHAAEHRAAVVHEDEEERLRAVRVLAEADDAPRLIAEHRVERQLRVEMLLDADFAGELRRGVAGGEGIRRREQGNYHDGPPHSFPPRCTTNAFARSIGILTIPFCLSTQPGFFSASSSTARISAMSTGGVLAFGETGVPCWSFCGNGCRSGACGSAAGTLIAVRAGCTSARNSLRNVTYRK